MPDGDADVVTGLVAAIGGVISVPKSGTAQVRPQAVMANGQLVALDPAKCTYAMTGAPSGTTVGQSTGVITAGETTGDADMTVTFRYGDKSVTAQCAVSCGGGGGGRRGDAAGAASWRVEYQGGEGNGIQAGGTVQRI